MICAALVVATAAQHNARGTIPTACRMPAPNGSSNVPSCSKNSMRSCPERCALIASTCGSWRTVQFLLLVLAGWVNRQQQDVMRIRGCWLVRSATLVARIS